MKDYKQLFTNAQQTSNQAAALAVAHEAFTQEPSNEGLLAWLAGNVFEHQIPGGEQLIAEFVNRFPSSLHPIRVYLAAMLLTQNQFDSASNEARIYLHAVQQAKLFSAPDQIKNNPILNEGVGRAFLQLTSVYTEAGARSYSRRALHYGSQCISAYWQQAYNNEINQLATELQTTALQTLDAKWEAFFNSGNYLTELSQLCKQQGFTALEKRLSLIEGKFRYDAAYMVDENELFQIIIQQGDTFGLM